MSDQEGKYNIKAAALMLGIQPGTLRAWERRYQMIAPVRNEAGHRLYTEAHIKILKWLIQKVNQGFTISQAVSLMGQNQFPMNLEEIKLKQESPVIDLADSLYEALIHFEYERINDIINTMFCIFSMEKVIIDIFTQILKRIEDSYRTGKIISAQKYFSLALIKARITIIIHGLPSPARQIKALCIHWQEDEDNIELLMFIFYLKKRGIQVINTGKYSSDVENDQIIDMIHPDLVIICCEVREELKEALLLVKHLSIKYQDITIGLVGQAINTMKSSDKEQYSSFIFGQTIDQWDIWLMQQMVL
ncbi:MerR family transcriptional regulator [Neobacillus sp. DY30]|uniref:MerR family transcriptional regulator n=1 Tax=Neobacillus sp. DY30 TaxID=3047871 RepID=UPI0024BFAF8E|nr:MerR family transcriptional regulator [Neobacillus sp. DY30]WHX99122.1 MerR family transcriptional regulator [Neobacillus sp. DY30]